MGLWEDFITNYLLVRSDQRSGWGGGGGGGGGGMHKGQRSEYSKKKCSLHKKMLLNCK